MSDEEQKAGPKELSPFPAWDERALSKQKHTATLASLLLPASGDVHELNRLHSQLDERYRALQADRDSASEENRKQRQSEESMLNQVLQWLSLGGQV